MTAELPFDELAPRRVQKSDAAFRTISEVSQDLDIPQHVLRFWEGRFPQIKPLKRGGGRRYYRPEDVRLLRRIRDLLYKDGYTIRGVQQLLREQGGQRPASPPPRDDDTAETAETPATTTAATDGRSRIRIVVDELEELRILLARARGGHPPDPR